MIEGVTPQHHDFMCRHRVGEFTVLAHQAAFAGELRCAVALYWFTIYLNSTGLSWVNATEDMQQRGFSATVGTNNYRTLSTGNSAINIMKYGALGDTVMNVASRDHPSLRLCFSRIDTNTGPPKRALKIPMGTSAGAATVRETVSAANNKMAPASAQAGNSQR